MNFNDMAKANDRNPRGVFGENVYFDNTAEDWARMEGYTEPEKNDRRGEERGLHVHRF